MHFISILPLALTLAASPLFVLAQVREGRLGFAIGTKHADGTCKYTADYEADFDVIKSQGTIVRGFAAEDCNFAQQVLPAAKKKGFQVVLGIW